MNYLPRSHRSDHREQLRGVPVGPQTGDIRKHAVRAPAEARIWFYSTSPRQQVVAFEVPDQTQRVFGDRADIDRSEFDAYVGEAEVVAALCLTEVTEFDIPLCPRSEEPSFRPPQSCAFLRDAGLPAALESRCRSETRNRRDARREPVLERLLGPLLNRDSAPPIGVPDAANNALAVPAYDFTGRGGNDG